MPKFATTPKIRKLMLIVWFALIVGSIYFVIAVFSRGSALAMSLALLLWLWLQPSRVKIFASVIPLMLFALLVIPLPEGYEERIQSAFAEDEELDHSAASRPHFWKTGVLMVEEHNTGVGLGCFQQLYDDYDSTNGFFGTKRAIHSTHFQILAETGYSGLAIWLLLILISFRKLWSVRKRSQRLHNHDQNRIFFFCFANAMIGTLATFVLGGAFYALAQIEVPWLVFLLAHISDRILREQEERAFPVTAMR
jgi:O-antigen ligase